MTMDFINLDFCIIENPLDKNKKPIIFVTRKGKKYLDETVIHEDDYEKAIYTIQNIGYIESDMLTFEFSQDPDFKNITLENIKETLEKSGMRYSEKLEKTMQSEFEVFNLRGAKNFIQNLSKEKIIADGCEVPMGFFEKPLTYKIPEIGQKLTLCFYLFIECKFYNGKCFLNLNGDFVSNQSSDMKNFIIPFKCDFIRINNIYNPNRIILKSCQTNLDILKRLPMDFAGSFLLKTIEKNLSIEKLFVYYLMEIKNNFPQDNRISIEIDSSINFDKMIEYSKKIKREHQILQQTKYEIGQVEPTLTKIKQILTPKMLNHADNDEFEKAAKIKNDIAYADNRIDLLKNIHEDAIQYRKYIKTFHLN